MKAAVITFGCKVNQAESASLTQALAAAGWSPGSPEEASLVVVNTCAVTGRAEREAVSFIRRLKRRRPETLVAATGCLAQFAPELLAQKGLADLVLGQAEKADLAAQLARPRGTVAVSPHASAMPDFVEARSSRTRAFLKIQDGCEAGCAYCAVPLARGPSRSHPPERVLAALAAHWAAGVREVVLTGVHLGLWGRDLDPPVNLAGLLDEIQRRLRPSPGQVRLRLSSLEPLETPLVWPALERLPWLAPHLHAPLQSGSDRVLALMGRPYRRAQLLDLLVPLQARRPDLNLGADVMCGFPGESLADFEDSVSLIDSLPLGYLHVFPFSPRPGTRACELPDPVPEAEKKRRVDRLRALDRLKRAEFLASQLGRRREALIENAPHRLSGRLRALTDNYVQALLPSGVRLPAGELVAVELAAPDNPWGLAEARL
ncbi:MAG: MiaB/RimO family radical SAM methylthiotransferase [Deltaproteobacteria bacterium]|nr:MiaB/RimO family radical SAM methylthiotransferase [Deltaproteobacteria bacterium]